MSVKKSPKNAYDVVEGDWPGPEPLKKEIRISSKKEPSKSDKSSVIDLIDSILKENGLETYSSYVRKHKGMEILFSQLEERLCSIRQDISDVKDEVGEIIEDIDDIVGSDEEEADGEGEPDTPDDEPFRYYYDEDDSDDVEDIPKKVEKKGKV
jgi:hypothetical protein